MPERSKKFAVALKSLRRMANTKVTELLRPQTQVDYSGNDVPTLLYALGFILCRKECVPKSVSDWTAWNVGGWAFRTDPRLPVDHAISGEREVWIAGDAFHPGRGVFRRMAHQILEGNFLETLDGIAGRFVLVYRDGSRIEIYNDAMGARSVFYGEQVVASHSGLAAEVLGSGLRDWIIPFITSRGYLNRDVKYLPGLDSPFEGVTQLTPNTKLEFIGGRVERYWPRAPVITTDAQQALTSLTAHLDGLRRYLEENSLDPVIGLSAGRDSRGVLAAVAPMRPRMFTFVRSAGAESGDSADSRTARRLAVEAGLDLEIVKVAAPPHLDTASSPFAVAFRQNTGYVRGNNSGWVEHYASLPSTTQVFIRGFGGEVMRGFYPRIDKMSAASLSNLYDVNAGSLMSREAFARFIERAGWAGGGLFDYNLSEMFYWEHRMGVWGASALLESDMAFRSMPGYNSRDMFAEFMGLPPDVDRRAIFEAVARKLAPDLGKVSYDS